MQTYFYELADFLGGQLRADEVFLANLSGEESHFVRFNENRVRQAGSIKQSSLGISLIGAQRRAESRLTLCGQRDTDCAQISAAVDALRRDLAVLGLERPQTVLETEDHIASLCEVMRYLIAGDDLSVSNLAAQQRFFNAHLRGWAERLFDTIAMHPRADFYRAVAGFARDFFAVEAQGFDLLES